MLRGQHNHVSFLSSSKDPTSNLEVKSKKHHLIFNYKCDIQIMSFTHRIQHEAAKASCCTLSLPRVAPYAKW
jgi:hypothetical protein